MLLNAHKTGKRVIQEENEIYSLEKTSDIPKLLKYLETSQHFVLFYANDHLQDDYDFVFQCCKKNAMNIQYASEKLRNNFDLGMLCVETNPNSLKHLSNDLQNDDRFVKRAIKIDPTAIMYAGYKLRCKKDCMSDAINRNWYVAKYASYILLDDKDFIFPFVKKYPKIYKWISKRLQRDSEIALFIACMIPVNESTGIIDYRSLDQHIKLETFKEWSYEKFYRLPTHLYGQSLGHLSQEKLEEIDFYYQYMKLHLKIYSPAIEFINGSKIFGFGLCKPIDEGSMMTCNNLIQCLFEIPLEREKSFCFGIKKSRQRLTRQYLYPSLFKMLLFEAFTREEVLNELKRFFYACMALGEVFSLIPSKMATDLTFLKEIISLNPCVVLNISRESSDCRDLWVIALKVCPTLHLRLKIFESLPKSLMKDTELLYLAFPFCRILYVAKLMDINFCFN